MYEKSFYVWVALLESLSVVDVRIVLAGKRPYIRGMYTVFFCFEIFGMNDVTRSDAFVEYIGKAE